MKLENVVPWGRSFTEYKKIFQLSYEELQSKKILGCGDGPSSFNAKGSKLGFDITSIDPIYQFSKDEIKKRVEQTSTIIIEEIINNRDDFVWDYISSPDELIDIRLRAMNDFLNDYESGKREKRYIYQLLPKLNFLDNSFDLVLSSHFLFLYSEQFDLKFHIDSIIKMCKIAKDELRVFPLLDLKNKRSKHLDPILEILDTKNYDVKIIKTDYEFQKGANEMLSIKVDNKSN